MAVYEHVDTYTVREEGGQSYVQRRFVVESEYNNFLSRPYPLVTDALVELRQRYPGETAYGDPLPGDGTLFVRFVDASRIPDSPNLTEIIVSYGPRGGTLQIPDEFLRYTVNIAANTVHETVDLDRNPIGWDWETFTANGTDVLQPETTITIPLRLAGVPVDAHTLHVTMGSVNSDPFLGAPDGMIQYLGAAIDRTAVDVYEITYQFQYVRQVVNINGTVEVRGGEHHYQSEMTSTGQAQLTTALDTLSRMRSDPGASESEKRLWQDSIRTTLYTPANWTIRQHRMYRRVRFQDFPGLENA